jgi:hypothetical protein
MNAFHLAAAANRCGCAVARLAIVAVVAGLSLFDRPAPAAIIIQDQFDYPTGALNNRNGGQGFSAAWQATSALEVTSPGLTYSAVETSGNAITGLNSGSMRRLFDNTGLTGDGATYWFSVLFAAPEATVTPSPNLDPGLVRESSRPWWGWKGFSDEEATQYRADRGPASAG